MFSVRKTTIFHGDANFYCLLYILCITSVVITCYGNNYLVIFLSSSILHLLIEAGLAISGIRKGDTFLFGKKMSKVTEILLRSFVEGPAFCVPAYYLADHIIKGNTFAGFGISLVVVGLAAYYLAYSDRVSLNKISNDKQLIISRRAMTKPKAVMLLGLLNTFCISMLFLIPENSRNHAFLYLMSYAIFVLLFYFINYNMGVRYIELYDPETKTYYRPGLMMQTAGLFYDSVYEMALLISIAYWVPFYLGLFN
jgi:hypothetical protein